MAAYNRKLSSALTPVLNRLGFTPNAATLLGLLCGLFCGVFMAGGTRTALFAGAAFLHLAFIFDNCDGELARLQNRATRFGRRLDMFTDVAVDNALWIGLYFGCRAAGFSGPEVLAALGLACFGSFANFALTLWERAQGKSLSSHVPRTENNTPRTLYGRFIRLIAHNGDSVALAWLGAIVGNPWYFLAGGAVFIQILWMGRLLLNLSVFADWAARRIAPALNVLGWFIGAAFVWMLARELSWREVSELVLSAGPGFLLILAVYPLVTLICMMGFYPLLSPATRSRVSWKRLFGVFLIGESVNKVTPFIDIGGEPLKVLLASRHNLVPPGEAVAAVCLFRIIFVATEIFFIGLGLALLYSFGGVSQELVILGIVAIVMTAILVLIFIVGIQKGLSYLSSKVAGYSGGAGSAGAFEAFREIYRKRKKDIFVASLWTEAGWIFFFFEVYITLKLLGAPVTLAQALVIQSLLQAVKTVSFFVPAQIGTQEKGLAHLVSQFNIPDAYGVALSLIKRLRQFVWFLLCLPFIMTDLKKWVSGRSAPVIK